MGQKVEESRYKPLPWISILSWASHLPCCSFWRLELTWHPQDPSFLGWLPSLQKKSQMGLWHEDHSGRNPWGEQCLWLTCWIVGHGSTHGIWGSLRVDHASHTINPLSIGRSSSHYAPLIHIGIARWPKEEDAECERQELETLSFQIRTWGKQGCVSQDHLGRLTRESLMGPTNYNHAHGYSYFLPPTESSKRV